MKKRIVSVILSVAMCFGFSSGVTMAAQIPVTEKDGQEMLCSSIGENTTSIFVSATGLEDTHGAQSVCESGGISLLTYRNESRARSALCLFEQEGYSASEDPQLELDATSYVYSPDVLGQYGKSVQESTHTNTLVLAPELMGLTYGASNIVGAQMVTSIKPVGVAVIDSGVDASVSILSGRVRSGYNALTAGASTTDEYGHGTFIASEIANNTPDNVSIIPIKVTDGTGVFTASRLAAALQYLASNSAGVNVVNLSLSVCTLDSTQMDQLTSFINPYIDALYAKGIIIVTSAGNYNATYPTMTANDSYPANYDKCIAVGALAYNSNTWTAYSQSLQGSCIDFWAPGQFIRGAKAGSMQMSQATAANGWKGEWLDLGDGTCAMSGTSQATAFVTAALAQILSYDTALPADNQMTILRANSSASAVGMYPEMSGYFYTTGVFNSQTGGHAGVVADWDVNVDTTAGTITLVKYTGNNSAITIPATYTVNGRVLRTVIGRSSATSGPFVNNDVIKTVIVADGVTVQDNNASYMFYGCKNLQSMSKIPIDVTDTSYMFYGCSSLLQYPVVPSKVIKMDGMFYGCTRASGTSRIESPMISSASDAYTGCTAKIEAPENSITLVTIKKLIDQWKSVTLAGSDIVTPGKEDEKSGPTDKPADNMSETGYKVTFYYQNVNVNEISGGKVVTTTSDSKGFITRPKNPTKKGYYFAGWYWNDGTSLKKFTFNDTHIEKDTELYAKWCSKKIGSTQIKGLKKTGPKSFWLSCKKATNATYYQIYVSSHKNFQTGQVIRSKSPNREITVLFSNKKYVKVRACRKLGGKWYYGKWSKVKTIKF